MRNFVLHVLVIVFSHFAPASADEKLPFLESFDAAVFSMEKTAASADHLLVVIQQVVEARKVGFVPDTLIDDLRAAHNRFDTQVAITASLLQDVHRQTLKWAGSCQLDADTCLDQFETALAVVKVLHDSVAALGELSMIIMVSESLLKEIGT